jgi:hypothetical protein
VSEHKKEVPVEPDILPLRALFLWVGGLCVLLVVVLVALWQFFNTTTTSELLTKQQIWRDPLVAEAHAREQAQLKGYAVVDAEKGHYRIPIRQAMDLLLENPALLAPIPAPPPASQSTTTPATVPAPSAPASPAPATMPAPPAPASPAPATMPGPRSGATR